MRRQISKKTIQPLDSNIDVVAITEQIKKIATQSERVILTPLAAECCAKAEIEFLNAVQIIRQGIIENIRPEVDQPGAWRFECFEVFKKISLSSSVLLPLFARAVTTCTAHSTPNTSPAICRGRRSYATLSRYALWSEKRHTHLPPIHGR